MYLGIYSVVCCAILAGFATTAEKVLPRNSDITFPEGDAIEGSGNDAEVNHDLESSGSGFGGIGVDDEDAIVSVNTNNLNTEKRKKESKKTDVYSKNDEILTNAHDNDNNNNGVLNQPQSTPVIDTDVKMNPRPEDKERSFFAQPGILAAVIGGAVVGLLCAILVVMFIVYRMRKKDEGSYALGEPKQSPTANSYSRGNNKEFYA